MGGDMKKKHYICFGLYIVGYLFLVSPLFAGISFHKNPSFLDKTNVAAGLGTASFSAGDSLVLLKLTYSSILPAVVPGSALNAVNSEMTYPLELIQDPLFFPSPFKVTNENVRLFISHNRTFTAQEIETRIYDMRGSEVFRMTETVTSGEAIDLKLHETHSHLPAGVYFYLVFNEGKVLGKGKGKFAVLP